MSTLPSSYTFFLDWLSEGQRMRRRRQRHILNVEGFWKPLHKRESKEDVAAARRIKRRVASQQQEKEDGRRLRCYIQRLSWVRRDSDAVDGEADGDAIDDEVDADAVDDDAVDADAVDNDAVDKEVGGVLSFFL